MRPEMAFNFPGVISAANAHLEKLRISKDSAEFISVANLGQCFVPLASVVHNCHLRQFKMHQSNESRVHLSRSFVSKLECDPRYVGNFGEYLSSFLTLCSMQKGFVDLCREQETA